MRRYRQKADSAGFTLIESIVVLIVLTIALCIAVPALNSMLARHQLTTAQVELIATLQHTRSTAVSSRRRTLLCPSSDGRRCSDDTRWELGWIVGHYHSTHTDQLDGEPTWVTGIHGRLIIESTAGRKRVRYQPDGTAGGSDVTFILCRSGHAEDALAVTVSNVGRVAGGKPSADAAAHCAANKP
jgi:type IV fimbrial biogenesis protein FimT